MRATKQSSPYMAPSARRMAEGGSAKPKRKVLLRKDGKKTEMSGRKADKIRKGVKEGKDKIRTGFLGLGKTYKVVQEEKAKAKSSGGSKSSAPGKSTRPKTRPGTPSSRLDSKGATPKTRDPRSDVKVTKRDLGRGKKDPRSDVKVTKRDLGRGKSTRATQSDRKEYRREAEMSEATRARNTGTSNLGERVKFGKVKTDNPKTNAARERTAAYSKNELKKRAAGVPRAKTRAGTSRVDIDKVKKTVGSGSRRSSGNRGS